MPRKSKKIYMKYSKERLIEAVKAVKDGLYSYGKASKVFNIPKTTIIDYAAGRGNENTRSGRKPAIPIELENLIAERVVEAASKGFGITKRQLLLKVAQLVNKAKITTPFKDGIPGNDWWRGFTSRHPEITIRKPEKLSTSRSRMLNKVVVENYFSDLGQIFRENPTLSASTIWNMDETKKGFEHNPSNVVARKGARNIPGRTSDSRENITVLATVNASGKALSPLCIVKGKTQRSLQSFCTIDAPEGTVWTYQKKARMDDVLGEQWFRQVFLANCGDARPQLLILDSHRSHEVLGLLEAAKQENIIIMALPPHSTHQLQPLDKGVFGPFSKAYDRSCTEFLSLHPDNNISKQTWPRVLKTAWEATFTPSIIKSSFQATGIYPLNPQIIPESAYAPSDAFDVPLTPAEEPPQQQVTCMFVSSPLRSLEIPVSTEIPLNLSSNSTDTVLELSPIRKADKVPFMPVAQTLSLNNTLNELKSQGPTELELSELGVPSQDDVPLLLMALDSSNTILSEVSESELNVASNISVWNTEVESIFSVPQSEAQRKPRKRALTSHRLLTSDEVMKEKRDMKEHKENLERLKMQRKIVREQKQAIKKLKTEKR